MRVFRVIGGISIVSFLSKLYLSFMMPLNYFKKYLEILKFWE